MDFIPRSTQYLGLTGLLALTFFNPSTTFADQQPSQQQYINQLADQPPPPDRLQSTNPPPQPQKRKSKRKRERYLEGLVGNCICCEPPLFGGSMALIDTLSSQIAGKVSSKYQGGNIIYCESGNTIIPSIHFIPDTIAKAKALHGVDDITTVDDLLRAKTIIGSAPHARIFSEGKMYQVADSTGKGYTLDIVVCPYTEYQDCWTECHDGFYRWFSDTNLDGKCDWISRASKELGSHRRFYYRPLQDKDAQTKRRAQKTYEKLLRKVAKCYGIKE